MSRVASFSPIPFSRVSVAIFAAACASLPSGLSTIESFVSPLAQGVGVMPTQLASSRRLWI